jgi:MoaA/NifB/PqqE/SkfB family radical SAM enzyme
MRRDVVLRIAQLVKRYGRFGNMTTNGTLFSQTDVEELVRLGWDRITFSLDGPDPQTNDWLRGRGTFRRIVQVIRWFNRWKARLGLTRPTLKLNTVISKKNYDKLPEMIRLAHQLGCEIVSFESLTVHSALGERLKLPKPAQADGYLRLAAQLAQKWGIYTNAAGFLTDDFLGRSNRMVQILKENGLGVTGLASSPCFEPWWHLVIKVDGSAQPCCLYDAKEENVKRSSLAHIWTGRFFRRVRAEMASHHLSHYCQICNAGQVMENRRIRAELTSLLGGLGG